MSEKDFAIDRAMDDVELLIADANLARIRASEEEESDVWLPQWFLEKIHSLDEAKAIVKAQAARLMAQIEGRKKSLWWKFGTRFQSQVVKDIANNEGKNKSVDYLTGRAGYRTAGGRDEVTVLDAGKASLFFDKNCPDAVRYVINKPEALAYHKSTGEVIPGVEIRKTDKVESFYPKPPDMDALDAEMVLLLEREGDNRE